MAHIYLSVIEYYERMKAQHFIADIKDLNELITQYELIQTRETFSDQMSSGQKLQFMWDEVVNYNKIKKYLSTHKFRPSEKIKERICKECGIEFIGKDSVCSKCRNIKYNIKRICPDCNKEFIGQGYVCSKCKYISNYKLRICVVCKEEFKGAVKICPRCNYKMYKKR